MWPRWFSLIFCSASFLFWMQVLLLHISNKNRKKSLCDGSSYGPPGLGGWLFLSHVEVLKQEKVLPNIAINRRERRRREEIECHRRADLTQVKSTWDFFQWLLHAWSGPVFQHWHHQCQGVDLHRGQGKVPWIKATNKGHRLQELVTSVMRNIWPMCEYWLDLPNFYKLHAGRRILIWLEFHIQHFFTSPVPLR